MAEQTFFTENFPQYDPRLLELGHDWITPPPIKPTLVEQKALALEQAKAAKELRVREERDKKYFMSDETKSTALGGIANVAGGVIKTIGDIDAWILGIPKTLRDIYSPGMKPEGALYHATEFPAFLGKFIQQGLEPFYNPKAQEDLHQKFAANYEENEGVLNVAREMAKTAVTNPVAGAEMFVTQLPYMMALTTKGVVGASAFVGLASDSFQQSLETFRKSYGREPDAQERAIMVGTSVGASTIEKLESLFLLGKIGKPLTSTAQKAVAVPARYVTGSVTEAGQEGAQNALIDAGGYQGKLFTDPTVQAEVMKNAAISAGMGATSGGVGGAGMRAIESVDRTYNQVTSTQEAFKQTEAYQPYSGIKEDPVKAYRAFGKDNPSYSRNTNNKHLILLKIMI
jgi:hypothetical protein